MRRKIVDAKIKYDLIVSTFQKYNYLGIKNLLGKDENSKVKVTESKSVVQDICNFFEGKPKTKSNTAKKITEK